MTHFVKAEQLPDVKPTWLDLVQSVVYDKSRCSQPSIRPLWGFFPVNIIEKEKEDVFKCDVDKSEDDSWNEYDTDFSAQWKQTKNEV